MHIYIYIISQFCTIYLSLLSPKATLVRLHIKVKFVFFPKKSASCL